MTHSRVRRAAAVLILGTLLLALSFGSPLAQDRHAAADSTTRTPSASPVTPASNSPQTCAVSTSKPQMTARQQSAMNTISDAVWRAAATTLGITTDQLQSDLKAGKPLADLAQARGVAVQQVEVAMLAAGQAQTNAAVRRGDLTQAQADALNLGLTAKLTHANTSVPQATPGDAAKSGGSASVPNTQDQAVQNDVLDAMSRAAAAKVGLSTEQMMQDLKAGKSLADLAAANHVTSHQVTEAIVAAGRAQLSAAVQHGTLTRAQADDIDRGLITAMVTKLTATNQSENAVATPGASKCGTGS
jgi:hypothetical protein